MNIHYFTHFLKKKLLLVVLGLLCGAQAFSSCGEWGLLSGYGARAFHCSGFFCCGARALGCAGFRSCSMLSSVVAAPGF